MRKLKRSIARANILNAGLERINKKKAQKKSLFATLWRDWAFQSPKEVKALRRRQSKGKRGVGRAGKAA